MHGTSMEHGSAKVTFVPWAAPVRRPATSTPRQMTPVQGRALETLAHAIEYLEDEAAVSGVYPSSRAGKDQMEAIATLKAASRSLWGSLPAREPLWRRWFHSPSHGVVVTLPMQ